jgi:hypothetical protein
MFLKWKGVEIDSGVFDLKFLDPQSFSEYRDIELNSQRLQAFTQVSETSYLSRRFILEKYLGLTKDEIKENERMWKEENQSSVPGGMDSADTSNTDLASVGIRQPNMTPVEANELDAQLNGNPDDLSGEPNLGLGQAGIPQSGGGGGAPPEGGFA